MTPRQLEIIQHALGCDRYGNNADPEYTPGPEDFPYHRNRFCAGARDEPDCRILVEMGFMQQHRTTEWLPYFNCSVTKAGKKAMREESPAPPKLTRSQRNYREFLRADLGITFREWIGEKR